MKPLDSEGIAGLGSSSKNEYLIDLIGNVARSAKEGLPIYRISGGAGFLWIASFGRKGLGTLRLAAVDSSAFDAEPPPAEASTPSVSGQQTGGAKGTTAAAQIASVTSAERDAQVARTEIERLHAERTQLSATIQRLEADKAAGEAKVHQMARTAFGTIIVLVVLAGIGAFAFVPRQRNGHASKFPSVIPETEEVPPSKPTNITEIELATAGDPKQFDAASSIALETNEPPLTDAADITRIEGAPADVRQPLASYSEPETEKPSPPEEAIRAELQSGGEAGPGTKVSCGIGGPLFTPPDRVARIPENHPKMMLASVPGVESASGDGT